jgi:S1-C subfamily serine protease
VTWDTRRARGHRSGLAGKQRSPDRYNHRSDHHEALVFTHLAVRNGRQMSTCPQHPGPVSPRVCKPNDSVASNWTRACLLTALAVAIVAGCTTSVHLRYSGAGRRVADWVTSIGNIEVDRYYGQFFTATGGVVVDTPQLSPTVHTELAELIREAIRRGGGTTGVANAPTLRVRIQQCTLNWGLRGGGILARAEVSLSGTVETANETRERLAGRGFAEKRASGVILASSAQPMLAEAMTTAIDNLLSTGGRVTPPPAPETASSVPSVRTGSGFLISESGHIATAAHVIAGSSEVTVAFSGEMFAAKVIAQSRSIDLAILKIEAKSTPWLPIASRGTDNLGDAVFTIGYPIATLVGAQPVYSEGSVSALSGIDGDTSFLQISVPVQPGNSGGPVVRHDGRVIGVITSTAAIGAFMRMTGTLPQNVNWAVRGDLLRTLTAWQVPADSLAPATDKKEALERVKRAVVRVISK